ncbi:MAG: PDDEXK nuclease domain-containing protein [Bacteroidales bacterium]|nr:PDDEXK nuclease domain-containing protein [Bacteroidales bacterium]MDD2424782.1 PDDEXK nuclease domain-containing protein [Bacteroidales bacterium]MDD3989692.1 PDDEXK nuclease domain-containing protein [Bacteroidales bacterium]MDD4638200.1 PDDEXK nuclease domain-containing protein [Bacteroidales bacterium]
MLSFEELIKKIELVHSTLQNSAVNAVNQSLTIRNWLIGLYIVEFEQNGEDRAKYGEKLIDNINERISHIKGVDRRSLFRFRQFYLYYPQIAEVLQSNLFPIYKSKRIVDTLSPLLLKSSIVGIQSPQLGKKLYTTGEKILTRLSYSHIELLISIGEHLKRTFYELECIKGMWSVRELKRQINTLYYERSSLSKDPKKLSQLISKNITFQEPKDIIKNIYTFEFLDIPTRLIIEESDLESALLDNLQQFIVELGNGFCFEARQKRILIGERYYFVDLLFYHRILKCHVLIELKLGEFEHGDIGQLNTYINYFKSEMMEPGDNIPIGILLVADRDQALVKYAIAGMDENLFIQKYLVQLPSKERLETYIRTELKKLKN